MEEVLSGCAVGMGTVISRTQCLRPTQTPGEAGPSLVRLGETGKAFFWFHHK